MRPIRVAVARARRRLRCQAAFEVAATASPVAAAVAASAVVAMRVGWLAPGSAGLVAGTAGLALIAAAAVAAAWHLDDEAIARCLDRDAGLSDRMSTAIAFVRDRRDRALDATTAGLARLAIEDGIRVARRADPERATPLRRPRDTTVAGTSFLVALLVSGIGVWGSISDGRAPRPRAGAWHPRGRTARARPPAMASDDLEYLRRRLGALRAREEKDRSLGAVLELAEIERQVDALERGAAGREDLLGTIGAVARRGHVAGIDDILEIVRRSRPPAPTEPPAPPPPPPPRPPAPVPPDGHGPPPPVPGSVPAGQAPGRDHDEALRGERSRERGARQDVRVGGADERATTRRETVRSAATHGFAGAPYRRVYGEYAAIVEDVMHAEQVPGTRRYVIERYFDRIRPW